MAIQSSSTLPQFFVEHPCSVGSCVPLSESDSHHAQHVLRLQEGERVRVVSSSSKAHDCFTGEVFLGTIQRTQDAQIEVCIEEKLLGPPTAQPAVQTLIFGMSKGKKNELVVEKATELGVESVILWQTARSILRLKDSSEVKKREERLHKVAEAAAKQSKRLSIPRVHICTSQDNLLRELQKSSTGPRLCCSLSQNSKTLSQIMPPPVPRMSCIAVGPEGDFTEEEEELLVSIDFSLLRLGNNTLRSETAAIAAIAMIQAICERNQ